MEITENTKKTYPYSETTNKIIACAIEVHRELGPGFIESIYEKVMIYELKQRSLKAEQQKIMPVIYRGNRIGEHRLDLLIEDKIVVENKAVKGFDDIHKAQILSYLKLTGKKTGCLEGQSVWHDGMVVGLRVVVTNSVFSVLSVVMIQGL